MTAFSVEAVEAAADDGVMLRGQLWAGGGAWVILLHDCGDAEDLDRWAPLAPVLAAHGWTVLAVDLRGHGASDGTWEPTRAEADVEALVGFARTRGSGFVAVAAAGVSAIAALRCAAVIRADALVLLSPPLAAEQPLTALRGAGEAKLIVGGGGDPAVRASAERLGKSAIGWVMLVNLPTAEQGTALLRGPVASHLIEHVVGFLAEQRFLAARRPGRPGVPRPVRAGEVSARSAEHEERTGQR